MRPTIAQLAQDPETWVDTFRLDGFVGPVALLDPADAWRLLAHIRTTVRQNPRAWYKNLAPIDHKLHWLATRPDLISVLRKLLGNDIVLSGAHVITRPPGESHPWHTDSESAAPDSRFVTVWLGLDNTSRESAFQLISRSHTIGKPIQQLRHEFGRKREEVTTEEVLGWARERIPDAQHVWPDISDGEAIIVDGRLWHTTENHRPRGRRSALVLQYAAADTPIRKPREAHWDWPLEWIEGDARPVNLVSGTAPAGINHVVPAPIPPAIDGKLSTVAVSLDRPLGDDHSRRWKPRHLFDGSTALLETINCHASVLSPGHCPHPPHCHDREEVLIVLDGDAEILLTDGPTERAARVEYLTEGSFSYYPAGQHHTIRNSSTAPVTYLMLIWRTTRAGADSPLPARVVRPARTVPQGDQTDVQLIFEGETAFLPKLHCHLTTLQPNRGYAPHTDPYDIAVVLLSGRIETGGQVIDPQGVAFFAAGEPHGMWNIGEAPARYLVLEFHAAAGSRVKRALRRLLGTLMFRSR